MQNRYESTVTIREHSYKIAIETKGSNTFGIDLIDDATMNRWSADFSASYIKNITRKVGSEKRISVFWRMLQTALEGTSNEVSFDILTSQDVKTMQRKARPDQEPTIRDDKRYIIITQTTEFEQIKYPLLLQSNPMSAGEFAEIIKQLKKENAILRQQSGTDKIPQLEAQIYDLNQAYIELRDAKDAEIEELKSKIAKLQSQQNTSYGPQRSQQRDNYSPRNSPRTTSNRVSQPQRSASVRNTSTYRRAPSTDSRSSRNSTNSRSSRGSARTSSSRGSSPGRAPARPSYYRSPQRNARTIEEETDEKLRKLKRFVAQKYRM